MAAAGRAGWPHLLVLAFVLAATGSRTARTRRAEETAASAAAHLSDYMEAVARMDRSEPPKSYGYKADVALGVGFFVDTKTGVKVLEKPIVVPSGKGNNHGYLVLYSYCEYQGVVSVLEGQLPPMLTATSLEPNRFVSLAAIANNFGTRSPEAASANSEYSVAFRVPAELVTKVEVPDRDLWLIRFDRDVVSPFLQAAREGNVDQVTRRVKDVGGEVLDEHGVSALMMAAMSGWLETSRVLLENGARVNATEPTSGRTPLMFAAQGGHSDVVSLLLNARADATQADSEGATPLMWAAAAGQAKAAAPLLAAAGGADTAVQIARNMGHSDVVAVLE